VARVLVAAVTAQGETIAETLRKHGREVTTVAGFVEAVEFLAAASPDLLIAELRLGPFNGLHLVLRHQKSHPTLRSIIIDKQYDPVLAGETWHYGAIYLVEPIGEAKLLAAVAESLGEAPPQRRWPRKRPVEPLVAQINAHQAQVVDLSYGGVRLEVPEKSGLPAEFRIAFPDSRLSLQARTIWTLDGPSGQYWCGATIAEAAAPAEWRRFVDSVHAES
jgi:DNA-binding response OmpR family regulator